MPPNVPTKRHSPYGGRQHAVIVFALSKKIGLINRKHCKINLQATLKLVSSCQY